MTRLADEPIDDRVYDCLVVPATRKSTIRKVRFTTEGSSSDECGWVAIDHQTDEALPASTRFALSGQRMVSDRQPLTEAELHRQILSGLYYDLRHAFRFPAVKAGNYWKDVGLAEFYSHGSIDRMVVEKVLAGGVIRTRWVDYTESEEGLRAGLEAKGCVESASGERGTYAIDGSYLEIVYLNGLYCHNLIGLDPDNNLVSMQVAGWSNNVGSSLLALSRLASQVYQDAILLDNGGDVFFLYNRDPDRHRVIPYEKRDDASWTVVKSCEDRYFIRSVLMFVTEHKPTGGEIQAFDPQLQWPVDA